MDNQNTTTQQITETSTPTWIWIVELIVPLITGILSIAWLLRDWDYEPALGVAGSILVFFIILVTKGGNPGRFITLGIVFGAACAYLLLFVIPQFGVSGVKTEPKESVIEKQELDNKVVQLNEQIKQLETIKNSSEAEIALRKKIGELETELEKLRNQPPGNGNPSSGITDPVTPTDPTPEKVIKSQVVNDVLFEVISAKPSGSQLEVLLYVTNKGPDRDLDIWTVSSITDEQGISYRMAAATNAPTLFKNVRNKVSIRFKGGAQSKSIQLMDIRTEKSTIQFRDLPITN